jgi:hypothetical protein
MIFGELKKIMFTIKIKELTFEMNNIFPRDEKFSLKIIMFDPLDS